MSAGSDRRLCLALDIKKDRYLFTYVYFDIISFCKQQHSLYYGDNEARVHNGRPLGPESSGMEIVDDQAQSRTFTNEIHG